MRRLPRSIVGLSFLVLSASAADAQSIRPEVVRSYPHDPNAFTQGLLIHGGALFESTGLFGESSVRRVALTTGRVELHVPLEAEFFGEGLAKVGDRLIQLTWKNGVAFVYDLQLQRVGELPYSGEGWGLCYDRERLVMSDGSATLTVRDPSTFAVLSRVPVRRDGEPVDQLNELECVGDFVYANVWQTDSIVQVDLESGTVVATIDASGLLSTSEAGEADVLNGIAHDPETGHFFLTGKLWPKLFEVRLPREAGAPSSGAVSGAPGTPSGAGAGANLPSAGDAASMGDAARGGALARASTPPRAGCGCRISVESAALEERLLQLALGLSAMLFLRRRASRAAARAAESRRTRRAARLRGSRR